MAKKPKAAAPGPDPEPEAAMTLFGIGEEVREIQAALDAATDPETGELRDEALIEKLDAVDLSFQAKAERVGLYLIGLDAAEAALKGQRDRYAEAAARVARRRETLKRYATFCLRRVGATSAGGTRATLTIRATKGTIFVETEALLPEWATRKVSTLRSTPIVDAVLAVLRGGGEPDRDDPKTYETVIEETSTPSKEMIRAALEAGIPVPGARLEEGRSLTVR